MTQTAPTILCRGVYRPYAGVLLSVNGRWARVAIWDDIRGVFDTLSVEVARIQTVQQRRPVPHKVAA